MLLISGLHFYVSRQPCWPLQHPLLTADPELLEERQPIFGSKKVISSFYLSWGTMRSAYSLPFAFFVFATGLFADGLPVPNLNPWDLTYGSNDTFTGFAPANAVVNPIDPSVTLYGTAAPGGAQRVLEFLPFTSADVCYSTSCPSTTQLYSQPNFVFTIGSMVFDPYKIIAGTGISSATTDFLFFGDLTYLGSSAPFPSADGKPVLYTGEDLGGTSSYVYLVNADGTRTDTLHVTDGLPGGAFLEGVLLDPRGTLTLDILGFADPGPNSYLTPAPSPEPSTLTLAGLALLLAGVGRKSLMRRKRLSWPCER